MKQKIQDKYRYCSTCQKVLLDHVVEGYEYDYWLKDPISGNRFGSTLFGYNEFIITGIYSIKIEKSAKYLIVARRDGHVTLFKFTRSKLSKADESLGNLSCLEY
ncbi:unnamed protein product [Rotaria sordida]|uniref:Uncharacterized protein n=1 Tax=Rotaria sordida TaxID=392033 RepID=A0A814YHR0_9BILA|nr:unnamed protein product [Rotaria sordida]CAF3816131.1 unnamed protein product [Rotaria sordida]